MYRYEDERHKLFTDDGQRLFLKVRDHVHECLKMSGAVTMGKATAGSGDSWTLLAAVDRLVELEELTEVMRVGCAGQDRVFVARKP